MKDMKKHKVNQFHSLVYQKRPYAPYIIDINHVKSVLFNQIKLQITFE